MANSLKTVNVLGVPIDAVNMREAIEQGEDWIQRDGEAHVTATRVHVVMESQRVRGLKRIHQEAGLCVPDGMPMTCVGSVQGHPYVSRLYGPDSMLEACSRSVPRGTPTSSSTASSECRM